MIRPRGTKWQADFTHQGMRHRKDFDTRREAEAWEAEMRMDVLKGRKVLKGDSQDGRSPFRLEDALNSVYERVWKGQKSSETSYHNGKMVIKIGGNERLSNINGEWIDELVQKMELRRYAPGTINRKLAALSKMLRFAHKRGWITALPPMERKREPQGRLRFFTEAEEAEIIRQLTQIARESVADLVEMLIDSGLRLSEALRLTSMDVQNGETHVREGKSSSATRVVPQTNRLKLLVQKRLLRKPPEETRLFWDLTANIVEHAWGDVRLALGKKDDPEWVPHTLRHTFISRLVQRGVNLRTVQVLAGHKSIMVTQRYAHLAAFNYLDAIKSLDTKHPIGTLTASSPSQAIL